MRSGVARIFRWCLDLKAHEQAWAKVNVHVDAKLLQLVSILSRVPKVETISSCQDEPGGTLGYIHILSRGLEHDCVLRF